MHAYMGVRKEKRRRVITVNRRSAVPNISLFLGVRLETNIFKKYMHHAYKFLAVFGPGVSRNVKRMNRIF